MGRRTGIAIGAISFLLAGHALAADTASPAPVYKAMPATAHNWSGFYVGAYAGYGWGKTVGTDVGDLFGVPWYALGGTFTAAPKGFIGGGQLGVNYQTGKWVFGVEADYGALALKGDGVYGGDTILQTHAKYDATVRLRIGYAEDGALFYITGGAINASFNSSVSRPSSAFYGTSTGWQVGWTLGGGIEYAFDPRWSIKGEYLYYDAGTDSVRQNQTSVFDIANTGSLARIGVNYKLAP